MNKEYINRIASASGVEFKDVATIIESLPRVIADCCLSKKSVAIPRFGTFQATYAPECITEHKNGKKYLNPPEIVLIFRTSVVLRNSLK